MRQLSKDMFIEGCCKDMTPLFNTK